MKKETLEEAKQRYAELTYVYPLEKAKTFEKEPQMELLKRQFELGAKWQQERSYSDEDLREAIHESRMQISETEGYIFEQLKKK